jgi:DNA-binding MarR family transcriptional regulator
MQHTLNRQVLRQLHVALIRIISAFNRPQRDDELIAAAGISLDRALFPLLVVIGRLGPIAVGDLADRVGRDHTTVSRQVAKLGTLGLVQRKPAEYDRRVSELTATAEGQRMNAALDKAREQLAQDVLGTWETKDVEELTRLLTRLAGEIDPAAERPGASQSSRDD